MTISASIELIKMYNKEQKDLIQKSIVGNFSRATNKIVKIFCTDFHQLIEPKHHNS